MVRKFRLLSSDNVEISVASINSHFLDNLLNDHTHKVATISIPFTVNIVVEFVKHLTNPEQEISIATARNISNIYKLLGIDIEVTNDDMEHGHEAGNISALDNNVNLGRTEKESKYLIKIEFEQTGRDAEQENNNQLHDSGDVEAENVQEPQTNIEDQGLLSVENDTQSETVIEKEYQTHSRSERENQLHSIGENEIQSQSDYPQLNTVDDEQEELTVSCFNTSSQVIIENGPSNENNQLQSNLDLSRLFPTSNIEIEEIIISNPAVNDHLEIDDSKKVTDEKSYRTCETFEIKNSLEVNCILEMNISIGETGFDSIVDTRLNDIIEKENVLVLDPSEEENYIEDDYLEFSFHDLEQIEPENQPMHDNGINIVPVEIDPVTDINQAFPESLNNLEAVSRLGSEIIQPLKLQFISKNVPLIKDLTKKRKRKRCHY